MKIVKPRPIFLNMVEISYTNLHEVFLFLDAYEGIVSFVVKKKEVKKACACRDVSILLSNGVNLNFDITDVEGHFKHLLIMPNGGIKIMESNEYNALFMTAEEKHLSYNKDEPLSEQVMFYGGNKKYINEVKTENKSYFEE